MTKLTGNNPFISVAGTWPMIKPVT